jgi:hypothetical protein
MKKDSLRETQRFKTMQEQRTAKDEKRIMLGTK